jgi:hypothetical protein
MTAAAEVPLEEVDEALTELASDGVSEQSIAVSLPHPIYTQRTEICHQNGPSGERRTRNHSGLLRDARVTISRASDASISGVAAP